MQRRMSLTLAPYIVDLIRSGALYAYFLHHIGIPTLHIHRYALPVTNDINGLKIQRYSFYSMIRSMSTRQY